jgi:phosphomannomutase
MESWVLFCKSGTEPVVRVYGEALDADTMERILPAAKELVLSWI